MTTDGEERRSYAHQIDLEHPPRLNVTTWQHHNPLAGGALTCVSDAHMKGYISVRPASLLVIESVCVAALEQRIRGMVVRRMNQRCEVGIWCAI